MKHLLLTTIAAVVLVGCGESQQSAPAPEAELREAAGEGNIEAVKQHIGAGTDVNAKTGGETPLLWAAWGGHKEIVELLIFNGVDVNAFDPQVREKSIEIYEVADILRKHGGKTGEELKAEGK